MYKIKRSHPVIIGVLFTVVYLASPLIGVFIRGGSPGSYLEFPPRTLDVSHPPFMWSVFIPLLIFVIITTWPFLKRMTDISLWRLREKKSGRFPVWGWVALAGIIVFWFLAWSRFPWLDLFQRLLFFPLWFCFIVLLNALAVKIAGRSLLTHRPRFFTYLFPVSALFWWAFEYLNRFVNNWHYIGIGDLGPWQYFLEATLAFSTVLPAVMSIRFLLMQTHLFSNGFKHFPSATWLNSTVLWSIVGMISVAALVFLGIAPVLSYPLTWIIPGFLWVVYQRLNRTENVLLREVSRGNFTRLWASACAALVCGFFWEMWNMYSAAKWIYNVPGVERFFLFEMPLLGYAGYLPFGVVCALVSHSLFRVLSGDEQAVDEIQ